MGNIATQVLPRRQKSAVSTSLQFFFLAGLIGLSAYLWKGRLEHDREMVKIAEKNTQTLEEWKRRQAGTPSPPRTPSGGGTVKPLAPPVTPYRPPATPGKGSIPGNEPPPSRPGTGCP